MQKKWSEVNVAGPAIVGILVGVGAGMVLDPLLGVLGWILTTAVLVGYRIWSETRPG